MNSVEVRFRVLRNDDVPATNPLHFEYRFGLQDTKGNIVAGTKLSNGALGFDFSLTARQGTDSRYPVFAGRFASGPVSDRFVYLS